MGHQGASRGIKGHQGASRGIKGRQGGVKGVLCLFLRCIEGVLRVDRGRVKDHVICIKIKVFMSHIFV